MYSTPQHDTVQYSTEYGIPYSIPYSTVWCSTVQSLHSMANINLLRSGTLNDYKKAISRQDAQQPWLLSQGVVSSCDSVFGLWRIQAVGGRQKPSYDAPRLLNGIGMNRSPSPRPAPPGLGYHELTLTVVLDGSNELPGSPPRGRSRHFATTPLPSVSLLLSPLHRFGATLEAESTAGNFDWCFEYRYFGHANAAPSTRVY